ncbi:MAG TPA: hypothetical protein PKA27_08170 [Fimbriimonadaceae bacterium]|nr:hypothetical protein [Fimbriimonadaceae bacterium]
MRVLWAMFACLVVATAIGCGSKSEDAGAADGNKVDTSQQGAPDIQ